VFNAATAGCEMVTGKTRVNNKADRMSLTIANGVLPLPPKSILTTHLWHQDAGLNSGKSQSLLKSCAKAISKLYQT
jgi:hypothetical protein